MGLWNYVVLYLTILIFCGILILTMGSTMSRGIGGLQEIRYFRILTWVAILIVVCEGVWCLNHLPTVTLSNNLMRFLCLVNLSASSLGPLCLYCFCWASLSRTRILTESKFHAYGKHIPATLMLVLHVISYWKGYTFSVDEEGWFVSGPLYNLHLAVCLGYLIAIIGFMVYAGQKTHHAHKRELIRLANATMFVMFGAIGQVIITSVPMVTIGNTLGMIYVTVSLLHANVTTDALTGLTNRRKMNSVLKEKFEMAVQRPFDLYLADIDGFKKINDTYGHQEGDAALIRMANAFRKLGREHRSLFVARYGGDEFLFTMDLRENMTQERLKAELQELLDEEQKVAAAKYRMTMQFGEHLVESKDESIEAAIRDADEKLYEQKKHLHEHVTVF